MAASVFMSYSHKDEDLRNELEVHLAMLKNHESIDVWSDRRLLAGEHLDWSLDEKLNTSDIILLLLSPDFLASDYCYNFEKARAIQLHKEGKARVVSVILRPCEWDQTELAKYVVTPKDGKPVTQWPSRDEAFLDITRSIRRAIEEIGKADKNNEISSSNQQEQLAKPEEKLPRSSNLRLKKEFTQADKDRFLEDVFEYIGRYFQGSLAELEKRNQGIETRYRKIDENSFTATIYRNGEKVSACSIRLGGSFGAGIYYSQGNDAPTNSMNGSLSVESDDQKLFLKPLFMGYSGQTSNQSKLSEAGAAEYYWSQLIQPMQGNQYD